MEDVNHIISRFAEDNNLQYIDFFEPFYDYALARNIEIDELFADGLHPNDDGYYVMYRIFMKSIGLVAKIKGATW